MAILFGLLAACAWGTGDFAGGLASRRAPETAVILATETIGLILLLGIALFTDGNPTVGDLALSATAGLLGVTGLALLYRGLARGRASVVAPLSAVGAAVLQVTWGLAQGEEPGLVAIIGIIVALTAIGVVAGSVDEPTDGAALGRTAEIQCGLVAAVGFGLYLILISETSHDAGLWTAVAARAAPAAVLAIGLPLLGRPWRLPRSVLPIVTISGITDAGANALLLVAVRQGLLSIVAPVANLFPAVTVLLSRAFGHERIGRGRIAGLGLAVVGLILIAL